MNKLYVGNIPWSASEQELTDLFSTSGKVASAIIIKDRETGKSKGFGFVTMDNEESALTAIEQLNGREMAGRVLTVNEAVDRPRREHRDSRDGGYGRRDHEGGYGRRDNRRN